MSVRIEPIAGAGDLVERVAHALREALSLRVGVAAVAPGTLPRHEMKASRFRKRK